MKTRMIKTAGLIFLVLMVSMHVDAQLNRKGGRCVGAPNQERHYAGLDLTDAQNEELSTMRLEHYKTLKPLKAKMAEFRAKQRSLLAEENPDLKAIDKVIDQESELMNTMRKEQLRHRLAMKEILSDEQVMKLEQRRKHATPLRQGRKGQRDGQAIGSGYGRGNCRGDGRAYYRSGRG